MAHHSTAARRSTIVAIILTLSCHTTTTAAHESSITRRFPFSNFNWISPRSATHDTKDPINSPSTSTVTSNTIIQQIKRGGGITKLKGSSSAPISETPGKKIIKKKKRTLKSSTSTNSSLKDKNSTPIDYDNLNKMPSIFTSPEDQKYDRYAAALAVTEGLRRIRDGQKKNKNAESEFLLQSTKAVKALGLSVRQFNEIGREVLGDEGLKERVSEQAYLYRMASTINLERIPHLKDQNDISSNKKLSNPKHKRHRIQMFARSITEIEDLRSDQINALKQSLNLERFPPGFDLTDPQVLPLLHPEIRAVCEKFPLEAEEIVKRYGLESEEFNRMLEETRGNPIFRWRVLRYVEKAEEERRKGE